MMYKKKTICEVNLMHNDLEENYNWLALTFICVLLPEISGVVFEAIYTALTGSTIMCKKRGEKRKRPHLSPKWL